MKRLICIALMVVFCFVFSACDSVELNTYESENGLVALYVASNKDSFFMYLDKIDTTEKDILDISISQDGARYAVTTRLKNKWKESENTESHNVTIYEGYYIFSADNVNDYLNFIENFNSEKYEIIDISVIPDDYDYFVTYKER